MLSAALLLLLAGTLAACASGRTEVESDLGIEDAPDWVNEGSQALNNKEGRLIHGFGSAPQMMDASLQRSTADDRARAEVARVLSSFMNVVSQDYVATAGYGEDMLSEQAISRQIENVTRLNMTGTEIIARWRSENDGVVYSLAELDMKRVNDIVGKAGVMNEGFTKHLQEKGETLFDRFIEENGK
ncbi:MAG TPA: hypothetical protein VF275_13105 [Gammaproteobacteria bacterium]